MPIKDKKFKRLSVENVGRAPERCGVYALYDAERELVYLGEASGEDSLRARLRTHIGSAPRDATRYKREPCASPGNRLRDLIREHTKRHGGPPRGNR
jgi:hypothetical protein